VISFPYPQTPLRLSLRASTNPSFFRHSPLFFPFNLAPLRHTRTEDGDHACTIHTRSAIHVLHPSPAVSCPSSRARSDSRDASLSPSLASRAIKRSLP
jgi:hypothetical protein